jgi:hypothetical protein
MKSHFSLRLLIRRSLVRVQVGEPEYVNESSPYGESPKGLFYFLGGRYVFGTIGEVFWCVKSLILGLFVVCNIGVPEISLKLQN